jgi:hypothetical protein
MMTDKPGATKEEILKAIVAENEGKPVAKNAQKELDKMKGK